MSAPLLDTATAALTVTEFGQQYRLGRTATYGQIKIGALIARKAGTKTLILRTDAERWAASLPNVRTTKA